MNAEDKFNDELEGLLVKVEDDGWTRTGLRSVERRIGGKIVIRVEIGKNECGDGGLSHPYYLKAAYYDADRMLLTIDERFFETPPELEEYAAGWLAVEEERLMVRLAMLGAI